MRTIAIINQKGGCGKTTTAINLAGVFARSGLRTLLVDLDPQSHCAAGLAIPEQRIDVQIGDAMLASDDQAVDWTRLLWRVSRNLDLAPSTVRLAGLESARGGLAAEADGHRRLFSVLSRVADQYDLCLIDCPPSIGMLTYNALVAATEVIIPVETAFFSLQGAGKQVSTIKALGKRLGVAPPFALLATMHNQSSPLAQDMLDELNRRFADHVVPVVIRFDTHLREAISFGQPVAEYAPQSTGAEDYHALARWLMNQSALSPSPGSQDRLTPGSEPSVTVKVNAGAAMLGDRLPSSPNSFEPEGLSNHADGGPATMTRVQDLAARAQRLAVRMETTTKAAPAALPTIEEVVLRRQVAQVQAQTGATLLGARPTAQGVLFVQPASAGANLAIVGEFNQWSPLAHPMKRNEALQVYEVCIPLPPGKYAYKVVADGRWATDAHHPICEPNPYGDRNSVVYVPEANA